LKKIESLMVNLRLNYINPRPRSKVQKALKSGVQIEVWQGLNCTKSKVQGKLGVQLTKQ
jgi:hypothetical protein